MGYEPGRVAAPAAREAFTVDEFAEAFRLSRATVYNMWRDGSGPAKMRVRGRVLISREAAENWRRQVEALGAV
jgi:excisionase family DNA binding protein